MADPVTLGLIAGGSQLLSSLFSDDPGEAAAKIARERLRFDKRKYADREGRRDRVVPFTEARARAQRKLRNRLLGEIGGTTAPQVDLSQAFSPGARVNPFAGGMNVTLPQMEEIDFSDEELGAGAYAPALAEKRKAKPDPMDLRIIDHLRGGGGGLIGRTKQRLASGLEEDLRSKGYDGRYI